MTLVINVKNKYIKIYEELVYKIQEGVLSAGAKLPSEHELLEQYGTSRETIRKALNLLSEHGFIQKIQGKGSIVLDVKKYDFPISGLVSFKELAKKMGHRARTIVYSLSSTVADDFLAEQLKVEKGEPIKEVIRIRELDKERVILDKDYLLEAVVPNLTEKSCANSLYEYIEEELGLVISFAKKEIVVEETSEEDKQLLDLDEYQNIVIVRNYVYLEDATLFQYTESRHRPDKFRFVDFARRNH